MARKGWEDWKPGCGWGAQVESLTQLSALQSAFWQAVLDGEVAQKAYPDESVTLRCENGPWKGDSFRLYPPEDELVLGPITYVVRPPTGGGPGNPKSVNTKLAWHLVVKVRLDSSEAA
jgi:hypothetical protein